MILRSLYVLVTALLSLTLADVEVTTPAAGSTITGPTLNIAWRESGKTPKIADLANYQVFLCAGGNDEGTFV
jgi:hypothetical protein